jgi:hypothetical protein
MSSGWLPKHRQLFFQIFQEGPKNEERIKKEKENDEEKSSSFFFVRFKRGSS